MPMRSSLETRIKVLIMLVVAILMFSLSLTIIPFGYGYRWGASELGAAAAMSAPLTLYVLGCSVACFRNNSNLSRTFVLSGGFGLFVGLVVFGSPAISGNISVYTQSRYSTYAFIAFVTILGLSFIYFIGAISLVIQSGDVKRRRRS